MKVRVKNIFTTVRTEGAMLPMDVLQRVVENDKNLKGLTPADYHLLEDEKLNEAINRSWSRLRGAWVSFQTALEKLPEGDAAIKVTRDRFLLPLFQELGYGRLGAAKSLQVSNPDTDAPVRTFPISHMWMNTPIHLVGFGVDLDKRTKGIAGAAKSSPHSLVQEFLNRSDQHLWAFVSNGKRLRILRDNASLTRQAYVEFDLEAMMAGEVYADFVLLWLLCHQSRVEAEKLEKCWLEQWSKAANEQGKRALEDLRGGVQTAIERLGQGFLSHSANKALREKLYSGELNTQDYYRQLLRLVYRLLFLFVAEDRELLLDPNADEAAKDRYRLYYSTAKLRTLAERRRGSRHSDLFQGLRLVMEKLGSAEGCPEIGLPALGSFLWSCEAVLDLVGNQSFSDKPDLSPEQLNIADEKPVLIEPCQITNADFLDALRALAFITDKHGRRPVDYKNLQSEELGSVYESLLELHPELNRDAGTFVLETASGNERKTTGSYYTPDSLVQCLLDSALNPVLEEAALKPDAETAILALKVCDPACGSGHFLIAAAHRMAKRLAFVRTGDEEPSPVEVQRALRDVIGRCVYGVDINPMAVELCKVALWMEALEPGKPLSFLDHHIQCGNSLIGATPALLRKGIPDEAFKPIEGDDKEYCKKYKKQNKEERAGQMKLFDPDRDNMPWQQLGNLAVSMMRLDDIADDDLAGVERKQKRYVEMVRSTPYLYGQFLADAWCAAFVWKKTDEFLYPITEEVFRQIERNPYNVSEWVRNEIERLREQYRFFHWHLLFPGVFEVKIGNTEEAFKKNRVGRTEWMGGFDVVLGNPPWEQIQFDEKEFLRSKSPNIAAERSARKREILIRNLERENYKLFSEIASAKRHIHALQHFIHESGTFPLASSGRLNTATLFCEKSIDIRKNVCGYIGVILPSSIAFDKFNMHFFNHLSEEREIKSFLSFYEIRRFFLGTDSRIPFCLMTLSSSGNNKGDYVFDAKEISELSEKDRHIALSFEDMQVFNPNTRNCPILRSRRSAKILKETYKNIPIIHLRESEKNIEVNPWRFNSFLMFMMDSSKKAIQSTSELAQKNAVIAEEDLLQVDSNWLPIIEGKMLGQYNHRFATFPRNSNKRPSKLPESSELSLKSPSYMTFPYYWGLKQSIIEKLRSKNWSKGWLIAWRDVTNSASERTVRATITPRVGHGDSAPIFLCDESLNPVSVIVSNLNSFIFDFCARQKIGGLHLRANTMEQLPLLAPSDFASFTPWEKTKALYQWLITYVVELSFTDWSIQPFAQDCGYNGPPFRWNESRRFLLRCELDAAYFHLYNIQRDDVDYIMETFPIVKRKDEKAYDHYRTKDTILQIYDAMTTAIETDQSYQTLLDPPPADPSLAHPPRTEVI